MTAQDIDTAARALYDACQTVKPAWEQLGDVTKGVWRERVQETAKESNFLTQTNTCTREHCSL